jgi:hypothetical protein
VGSIMVLVSVVDIEGTALAFVALSIDCDNSDLDFNLSKDFGDQHRYDTRIRVGRTGTCIVAHSATDPASARQALGRRVVYY